MESTKMINDPLSENDGEISTEFNDDIIMAIKTENANEENGTVIKVEENWRLNKQYICHKNAEDEKYNIIKKENVSAFNEDVEFPVFLNRSKKTTYGRNSCSKTEIPTEKENTTDLPIPGQPANASTYQLRQKSESSPSASNTINSAMSISNTSEAQPVYNRIRVSTNIFNTKTFEPSVPSTAEINKLEEISNTAQVINDRTDIDVLYRGDIIAKFETLPTKESQNYQVTELTQLEQNISYNNANYSEPEIPESNSQLLPNATRPKHYLSKIVVCDICDLDFISWFDLKAHLKIVHRPWALEMVKEVYCVHCRTWFDDEFQCRGHSPCYKTAVRLRCPICYMERPLLEHFALHNIIFRPGNFLRCTLCKRPSRHTVAELNIHRQKVHGQNGVYECLQCDETYARLRDLKWHQVQHLASDVSDNVQKALKYKLKIKTQPEQCYVCDVCGKKFFEQRFCVKHRRTHDRPLCSVCGLSFKKNSHLVKHQNVHFKNKTFACPECDKTFTLKNSLAQHMKIHIDKKNFPCDFCKLTFTQQTSLVYHTATHTNENIFTCSICDITFDKQSKVTSHMKMHNENGTNPNQCQVCRKYFAHNCNLLVHMRMHPEWKKDNNKTTLKEDYSNDRRRKNEQVEKGNKKVPVQAKKSKVLRNKK